MPDERPAASRAAPAGRLLGVDLGTRRIGLALSDPAGIIASPFSVLSFTTEAALVGALRRTCTEHGVRLVVLGHPVRTDGTPTRLGVRAARVAATLAAGGVPACTWDEQFTSRAAAAATGRRGQRGRRARTDPGRIDRVAAALMLADYLQHRSSGRPRATA